MNAYFNLAWSVMIGGSLLAAASPANNPPGWHTLLTDFGFPIALVLFFVWNGWKREEQITNRLAQVEDFLQNKLLAIDERGVQAIADNTAALDRLVKALEDRPCLCGEEFIMKLATPVNRLCDVVDRLDQYLEHADLAGSRRQAPAGSSRPSK